MNEQGKRRAQHRLPEAFPFLPRAQRRVVSFLRVEVSPPSAGPLLSDDARGQVDVPDAAGHRLYNRALAPSSGMVLSSVSSARPGCAVVRFVDSWPDRCGLNFRDVRWWRLSCPPVVTNQPDEMGGSSSSGDIGPQAKSAGSFISCSACPALRTTSFIDRTSTSTARGPVPIYQMFLRTRPTWAGKTR